MKNFKKLKEKRPGLASELESMSREELMEHYAIELSEKDELEEYKENQEFYKTELEYIVGLAEDWLTKNRKDKHHIIIEIGKGKLLYTHEEKTFI